MDAIERCMRKIKQRENTHKQKKMKIQRVVRHEAEQMRHRKPVLA